MRLGLERARVETLAPRDPVSVERARTLVPPGAALLYPALGAADLGEMAVGERPRSLVLLDGTWSHAKVMFRDCPWLAELPRVRLTPARPSRYRIRAEPRGDYTSTLEALIEALRLLEPETPGFDDLLDAFAAMIDRQIDLRRERSRARTKKRPPLPRPRVPQALLERYEDLVLVYAEVHAGADGGERNLIRCTALRPCDGSTFDAVRRPTHPPPAEHLAHMELDAADLAVGLDPAAFEAAWQAFARPGDVWVAWSRSSLDALRPNRPGILLKEAYCNLRRRRAGRMEAVLQREGAVAPPARFPGRAGRRIALASALLEVLRRAPGDLRVGQLDGVERGTHG